MDTNFINEEKVAIEAADNYTENQDVISALEDNGFTLADLAENLGMSLDDLDEVLHRNLAYGDVKASIMQTIERMAEYRKDHQPEE